MQVYGLRDHVDNQVPPRPTAVSLDLASMETWDITGLSEVDDYWDPAASMVVEGTLDPNLGITPSLFLTYVYSERVRRLFEAAGFTGIRYFPIRVSHVVLGDLGPHWYGHVSLLAGALDKERSVHFINRGIPGEEHYALIKPVIIGEVAAQRDFFRFAESKPGVYASERVRDLCVREGLTNMVFRKQKMI